MKPADPKLHCLCLLGLTLVMAFAAGVTVQSQDETQTVPATGTISGRVVTENGQPLPNAAVYLGASIPLFQPRIAITDSEGNFKVSGLDPSLYGISVSVPAYVPPFRDPNSPPSYYRVGDSVTLNLMKGGVITGTILSSSGEPVVQVAVRAVLVRDSNRQQPKSTTYQLQKTTDDRGVYRIYGLLPGSYLVSAGGRDTVNFLASAFDNDAPTYAPSSTRDTASEITVRAGEETGGVDIRYRGEPGHVVSGFVKGPTQPPSTSPINISLVQISNGAPLMSAVSFQMPNSKGFAFYGVGDGDYDLTAQFTPGPGEIMLSEPRRITLKGADITGIELSVKPLGSISGHVALETSNELECKDKRKPLFTETLVVAQRSEKGIPKDQARLFNYFSPQGSPNKSGDFQLRNLGLGQYNLNTRFFAKYWYLRSIEREGPAAPLGTGRAGPANRQTDVARTGVGLKFGERASGLILTLAEGAASLRGTVKLAPGENIPARLYVHLVPAEKENADDVLRFFAAEVNSDGTFVLNNLPPGRYWTVTRVAADSEFRLDAKVRAPDEAELRAQIRRAAEAAKTTLELKPCKNLNDYQLPLMIESIKN